ncbi:MAG: hypothetical protein LW697_09370 [Blastopirellula sp.]|jgi:hypothetical protein|nr:hypothetical protein [Blastopirellula sp.]
MQALSQLSYSPMLGAAGNPDCERMTLSPARKAVKASLFLGVYKLCLLEAGPIDASWKRAVD